MKQTRQLLALLLALLLTAGAFPVTAFAVDEVEEPTAAENVQEPSEEPAQPEETTDAEEVTEPEKEEPAAASEEAPQQEETNEAAEEATQPEEANEAVEKSAQPEETSETKEELAEVKAPVEDESSHAEEVLKVEESVEEPTEVQVTAQKDETIEVKASAEVQEPTEERIAEIIETAETSQAPRLALAAANTVASGTCGDNLTWTLDGNGTLIISGSGEMDSFSYDEFGLFGTMSPWHEYNNSVTNVTIQDGVTSIGDSAFQNCNCLTNVDISESVTSIGSHAFFGCANLASVKIPDKLTKVEASTFSGCSSLTSIVIPDGVTFIGGWAFYNCTKLARATIPSTVTEIEREAFHYESDGQVRTLPNLTILACSMSEAEDYANNNGFPVVLMGTCGDSLKWELNKNTLIISGTGDMCAWGGHRDVPWYNYRDAITNVVIETGPTEIGAYAFWNCGSLTSVTIPSTVSEINDDAFFNCSAFTDFCVDDKNQSYCSIDGVLFDKPVESILCVPEGKAGDYIIPEGVIHFVDSAFRGCNKLTSVTIPDGVTSIASFAFENCSNLSSVSIPTSVTEIGYGAFENCSSLTNLSIPKGVTSIGESAFEGCTGLTEIIIPDGVTRINQRTFCNCSELTSVTIPSSVTKIYRDALIIEWEDENGYSKEKLLPKLQMFGYTNSYANFYCTESGIPFRSVGAVKLTALNQGENSVVMAGQGRTYFTFSPPAEGKYSFKAETNYSIIISVENSGLELIAGGSRRDDNKAQAQLKAGETYYIKLGYESDLGYEFSPDRDHTVTIIIETLNNPEPVSESIQNAAVTVSNQTYTGKALRPVPAVALEGKTLDRSDYDVSYFNNTNAGIATVTITGKGNYTGTVTKTFQINKASQTLSASVVPSLTAGKTATITAKGIGSITYTTSDSAIATVSANGVVTAKAPGTVTITVKAAGNGNYNAATKTVKIAVSCANPSLKKVENINGGVKLTWGKVAGAAKYRVFYKTGKGKWTKLADTAATSYTWKKAKSGTKYSFTIRCLDQNGKYVSDYNKTGKSIKYIAAPKLTKVQNTKAGVKVTWKKSAGAVKYRVLRKTGKGKWVKVGDTTKLTFVDKKVKKGVKYTYTVRCISKNGKNNTSAYNTKGLSIKRK